MRKPSPHPSPADAGEGVQGELGDPLPGPSLWRGAGHEHTHFLLIEPPALVPGRPAAAPDEASVEQRLRPARLVDYVGQKPVREQMEIFISAARQRSEGRRPAPP